MWSLAQVHAEELHDVSLQQTARLILGLSSHEIDELGPNATVLERIQNAQADSNGTLRGHYRYQLFATNRKLLLSNYGAADSPPLADLSREGFGWIDLDGERWRTFHLTSVDHLHLVMAERASWRDWLSQEWDVGAVGLIVLSMCVLVGAGTYTVRLALRPLREITRQLGDRAPDRLKPIELNNAPAELKPVARSMNGLIDRMSAALRREVEFTSLAAHELRTPLASMRALARAIEVAPSEAERHRLMQLVVGAADRCTRLQDQLLALARIDLGQESASPSLLLLAELVIDAVAEVAPAARVRGVRVASAAQPVELMGDEFAVRCMLRNLLSNAVAHATTGGEVRCGCSAEGSDVLIEVHDNGPGIPPENRVRAFDRFERLGQRSGGGAGLGLAIVRRAVQQMDGIVILGESPLGGLAVEVRFPGRLLSDVTQA